MDMSRHNDKIIVGVGDTSRVLHKDLTSCKSIVSTTDEKEGDKISMKYYTIPTKDGTAGCCSGYLTLPHPSWGFPHQVPWTCAFRFLPWWMFCFLLKQLKLCGDKACLLLMQVSFDAIWVSYCSSLAGWSNHRISNKTARNILLVATFFVCPSDKGYSIPIVNECNGSVAGGPHFVRWIWVPRPNDFDAVSFGRRDDIRQIDAHGHNLNHCSLLPSLHLPE